MLHIDLRLARAAAIHFQAVANQAAFVQARDTLADASGTLSPEQRQSLREEIRRRLESEIALARELYTLTREDSRIGFEPSCHYFYLPLDLVEKVVNCQWLLGDSFLAMTGARRRWWRLRLPRHSGTRSSQ